MGRIKIMDEILANKIAAGEVVEKIASAVKELVENSVDAKSTEIKIELTESGLKQIRVTDNGIGMNKEDANNAFLRHATSKLLTENDLYRINTLGFRGEALPSIASVSKISLTTSEGGIGTHIILNGGIKVLEEKGNERIGTIMEINDLFYNTPARLKHIKNLYTELGHITDYVNKMALARTDIKFTLINNDKTLLETSGRGDTLKTIKDIYGIEVARSMMSINGSNEDYDITGFISNPSINRSNKNHMITFVNGRLIKNFDIMRSINDAYHTYKPDTRYPIVVLNINCDPTLIDVNIHPTKMDIKFSKAPKLNELLNSIIKDKIMTKNLIPKIETPSVPIKTNYVVPTINFDNDSINTFEEQTLFVNEDLVYEEKPIEENEITMPSMFPVGLVHGTYIIAQNETGMYLIDQHAAKERVNYEIVKKELGLDNHKFINMLVPLTLEFTTQEALIIKENFEFIKKLNIGIEEFGINSFVIKSHPIWLPKNNEINSLRKILELIITEEKNFSIEKFNEKLAIMMSCKMSIKANTNLTMKEMEQLIDDLRNCENPYNCPHGRPTVITYSKYELEKLFKRSGFESLK